MKQVLCENFRTKKMPDLRFFRNRVFYCIVIGLSLLSSVAQAQSKVEFPSKSIGGITKTLDAELHKPQARLIHFIPTPPVRSGGIEIIGPNFASFDTFSVRTNEEGSLLFVTVYACEQRRGSSVIKKRRKLEIPNIDPSRIKGVNYVHNKALTEGIPEGNWVVIESEQKLNAKSFYGNRERAIVLPRFGFGFTTRTAANSAKKLLDDIKERGKFEAEVKNAPKLTTFYQRYFLYDKINKELHKQKTNVGFFGAASSVTLLFSVGFINDRSLQITLSVTDRLILGALMRHLAFSETSQNFMKQLSQGLSQFNVEPALEILRTGTLTASGQVLKDGKAIDEEMVRREQQYAEQLLGQFDAENRSVLISDINTAFNRSVEFGGSVGATSVFSSLRAVKKVYDEKRLNNPEAQLDYSILQERIKIGEATAEMHR
jgi:hypothetical protein